MVIPTRPVHPPRNLGTSLVVILIARTFVNTVYRAPLSFLPVITKDLGISLEAGGALITLRNLTGFSAPILGPLSDRYGRVTLLVVALVVAAVACLLFGIAYVIPVLALALIAATVAKSIFDPAVQAFFGDRVPYAERGRMLALSEIAWSAASLLGLPLVGFLAQQAGWRAPFVVLSVVIFIVAGVTLRVMEPSPPSSPASGQASLRARLGVLRHHRSAAAVLATSFLMDVANENVGVVYAAWLSDGFHLDAAGLGLIAAVIGFAELCGELASSGLVDRIGKKRTVTGGLALTALMTALLPLLGLSVWTAALGIFAMFLAFEFSLVSSLPLLTELVPTARGAFASINVAAFLLGRSVGSLTGPLLYTRVGFLSNGLVSAAVTAGAALLWYLAVREYAAERNPVFHIGS